MVFENTGYWLCMFAILFCDHSKGIDLNSIVDMEVFERLFEIFNDNGERDGRTQGGLHSEYNGQLHKGQMRRVSKSIKPKS